MSYQTTFRLSTISLLPQQVTASTQGVDKLLELPRFRLEVWLGAVQLDETEDISFFIDEARNNELVLDLKGVCFRYQLRELFSRAKTVKLHIKLYRSDLQGNNQELFEEFNLTLSQYSYEYSKSEVNVFREHSVGLKNKSYLHYRIQCDYDTLMPAQPIVPELRERQEEEPEEPAPYKRDLTLLGTFPVSGGEEISIVGSINKEVEKEEVFAEKWSDVFIQTAKLKPIYQSDGISNDKIYIKLEKSFLQMDGQTQLSTISELDKIKEQTKDIGSWLQILFLVISIPLMVFLMHPYRKV